MVLRLTALAALALAGTVQAQDPVYVPAKKPVTTKEASPAKQAPVEEPVLTKERPVHALTKQPPTTKQGATTKSSTTGPAKQPPTTKQGATTKAPTTTAPTTKSPTLTPAKRGWLGFRTDPNDSEMIFEVAPDSPAERAGIQPGDRIVSSDRLVYSVTKADSASDVTTPSRFYVSGPIIGATYRMTLARDNRTFDVSMVAVAPPEYQRTLLRPTRMPGTVIDTLSAEVEAFRTELARTTLQPTRKAPPTTFKQPPELRTRADSEAARQEELYLTLDRYIKDGKLTSDSGIINDPELYENLKATITKTDLLLSQLDRRPNAISGAEFEQLNPALGEYFGVPEGVLVIRVGAESPAATAGLQPGDVVKTVNDVDVASISSLRERIASTTGTITLGVIRKGRPVTVTLRKE